MIDNKLNEYFGTLNYEQLHVLYLEAESFTKTGILPLDAEIRKLAQLYLLKDNLLEMMVITNIFYQFLAHCIFDDPHIHSYFQAKFTFSDYASPEVK